MEAEKSSSGGYGGGGGSGDDDNKNNDQNNRQQPDKSAGNIGGKFKVTRRRRRPGGGGGAEHDEDGNEEESKAEIESLAAASGFGRAATSLDNTANNHQTMIADCQSRPGAYAVDGPDADRRRISDVSGEVVLGLDGDAVTASSGNQQPGGNRRWSTRSVQSGQSGQSGRESENSAVAEVRAALEAEREAARASGMGTRRPSMARSSITSGVNVTGSSAAATDDISGRHRRTSSIASRSVPATGGAGTNTAVSPNSRSGDLAHHPDIEFLAEATLVVDSVHDDDDGDKDNYGDKDDDGDDHDEEGEDPPTTDLENGGYMHNNLYDDGDVSTLGPPPELSQTHGTSRDRGQQGRRRQRRSARPTDPYADVLEATCTSVDEGNNRTSTRSQGGQHETTTSPMEIEEGSGAADSDNNNILVAEPLKGKCLMNRRTVVMGLVIGVALLLAVALGVSIPLSKREDVDDSSNGNSTYPAFQFNPPNSEVLTTVPEPICFSLLPIMTNVSQVCTDPITDLPKGGPMDQLIAEGLLKASDPAAKIEIALINGGAFRSDIFAGDLTAGFVRKQVVPFTNNRVAYLSVTPAEIYETLNGALVDTGFVISEEQQAQFFPESPTVKLTWPYESTYPYAAGLRYDVDLNAPEGQKATNVRIHASSSYGEKDGSGGTANKGDVEDGWVLLDPTDDTTLIRALSSDYLAGGGDGYFQTVPEDRIEILDALGITQLFLYYCSLQKELVGPHYIDEMSTRDFVPLDGYENDL